MKCRLVYLRDGREPYWAIAVTGNGDFGISICHKGLDRFDKKLGARIAIGRANSKRLRYVQVPGRYRKAVRNEEVRLKELWAWNKLPMNYEA